MQVDGELGRQLSSIPDQADAQPIPNEAPRTRKITVQLSEGTFQRLEAAIDRPGVGKSMIVETALERFLDPAPPVEGLIHEELHRINRQISDLHSEIAVIAETVALHARYHFTVTPVMPHSQQQEACSLGHERFKALAEQVERRVRLGRPLIRETIDRLRDALRSGPENNSGAAQAVAEQQNDPETLFVAAASGDSELSAAAGEGGSNLDFRHLPNAFC